MSAIHPNDARAAALTPEVRGSVIPHAGVFSWLEERWRSWKVVPGWHRLAGMSSVRWLLAGLVLGSFWADTNAPRGIAMWLSYVIPLALSQRSRHVRDPFLVAAASTLLVLLVPLAPLVPLSFPWPVELYNRVVFGLMLWLAAFRIVRQKAAEMALKESEARSLQLNELLEQRVRERTSQLEAANRELEAFAYSVSHDLRAPLRAVDGFAGILEEDHGGRLNEDGLRTLAVIRSEAGRMGRLINHLLELARVGRHAVHVIDTDMALLAREALGRLQANATDREVDFQLGELPVAPSDPALLQQVWVNLLDNALKYTRRRQRAEIRVDGWSQGGELVYCVRDNGAGFDMRYADRLFRPFQRLHSADEFEGSGVGLAVVQRIVHRHGGRVWAESLPGQGACFFFTLPASPCRDRLSDGCGRSRKTSGPNSCEFSHSTIHA